MTEAETSSQIAEAERRGFFSGLNVGLLAIGILFGVGSSVRSLYEIPRLERVYSQVKVPMPGLTLLVLNTYPVAVAALLLGVAACAAATRVWGHRRRAIVMNALLVGCSLMWALLSTLATYRPFMSVIGQLGGGRP